MIKHVMLLFLHILIKLKSQLANIYTCKSLKIQRKEKGKENKRIILLKKIVACSCLNKVPIHLFR